MAGTRQAIVRMATEIVRRNGVEALTLRALAERLDLTAPAFYRHFADKEALLETLVEEGFGALEGRLLRARKRGPPLARLRALLVACLEFSLRERKLAMLMFQARRRTLRSFPADFAARRSRVFNLLADEIGACMRAGALREDDVLEVGLALWAQVHGLLALYRLGRLGRDESAFRRLYRRSIERLLRGLAT